MTKYTDSAWGHPDRHYAIVQGASTSKPSPTGSRESALFGGWEEVLSESCPDLQHIVERTVKQWNNVLRDYMRTETGLRLSVGDESQSVPVRVINGMPKPFSQAISKLQGLEWALLNRPALVAAVSGTEFMIKHHGNAVRAWGSLSGAASVEDIQRVQATAKMWLLKLEEIKAVDTICGINEDVLGAYFFRQPSIRLYWVVIGIVAATLGVSPESLTVVVLTHELAHAYTHLGRDIDDERWETEAFGKSDLDIVEGLAQFYTQVICTRLEYRMPAAIAAYKALLAKQSGPYQAHLQWIEDQERGGEIVRVSMIECRSCKIASAAAFSAAVGRHRAGVKGRARPPKPKSA